MRRINGPAIGAALALILLSLSACAKHEEPAPVAALPPPPAPPPPPPPPPAPSADDVLQGNLSKLGAMPSNGGWSVTLSSAKFHGTQVTFSPEDQATLEQIASVLKDNPHTRVQIENYLDKRGAKAHVQEQSQTQANSVLRDLTSSGADESRIQAQGLIDTSKPSRVEIMFSNAAGEFHAAPVENS